MLTPIHYASQLTSAELASVLHNLHNVYNVKDYGALVDGTTDDTTAVNAAVSAAVSAGGGTIFFPVGTCLCLSAIDIPYTGPSAFPVQKPLRFTGVGAGWNGYWQAVPTGGSTLDLRYAGGDGTHVAKIDTRGAGIVEFDHLVIKSGGSDDYQIMQTTNTTVFIHHNAIIGNAAKVGTACVQDFIKFGGTSQTIDNSAGAAFQGYGSKLNDNFYSNIQRGSLFGNYCNGIEVENETFSSSCGSALAQGAPYYFDPGSTAGNEAAGNRIKGATLEMSNYKYGVSVIQLCTNNTFESIGMYDPNVGTLAWYYFAGGSIDNTIVVGYGTTATPLIAGASAASQTIIDSRSLQASQFPYGIKTITSINTPVLIPNADSTTAIQIQDTAANAILTVDSTNKRIGIGTTTPGAKLDVNGSTYIHGGAGLYLDTINHYTGGGTPMSIGNANQIALRADTGFVGIGVNPSFPLQVAGSNPTIRMDGATPGLSFKTTQAGTKEFKIVSGYNDASSLSVIDVTASNAQRILIDTNGNVGIGQTSPTASLDVVASTTTNAGFRLRSGVAPTSPNDGDIWYDGTNLKIRVGGTTKTVTIT